MVWRQAIEVHERIDRGDADGEALAALLRESGVGDVRVRRVAGDRGHTDFVRAFVPGSAGRSRGGTAPTLGIIGRLGGVGARPEQIGIVSDADGALVALTAAAKLGAMSRAGDVLPGDVVVTTHVCPDAPTLPHDPVPFMNSPVDMAQMNANEVEDGMDAVLSIDATKGNRVCNHRGFAISPTVRQGWVLRVSEGLLDIAARVGGRAPAVLPITTQDITPYGNGVFHVNSILQPATATDAPVVGVAVTAESVVPGSGTGATDLVSVEETARFCVEVAKDFGRGVVAVHDAEEFAALVRMYGSLAHLRELPA
ncbi:uncharacterized protein DUF1177 [Murinocardiopsis flavida]|uniref:Uncharacterized protein DUF1177 n=1 Tax=Murinocardiopsis flavida TaxID=645275 RepID=A0A2P8DTQ9_9ACTN|nr:DUF1177 domain-containing protein [Murinocardiopsis flavida]PSL00595.1 uncharacterized protein DUF1177 [Murinocardiopsis flavida]